MSTLARSTVFILEDNEDRVAAMRDCIAKEFSRVDLAVFGKAPTAIAWLSKSLDRAVLISLDHDLELPSGASTGEDAGTGRDVANYLTLQEPQCPVVIHSTNVVAAIAMESDLLESRWCVERITPYDDLAWIAETWVPLVKRLIAPFANPSPN